MNISRAFVLRPVMTTLVMFALILFGLISYFTLPVSDLPPVDFPTISVTASVPGASPSTMAASVATSLEKQFSTIAGLDNMNSTSQTGQTQITLQFDLTRSIDGAAEDVQAAIVAARPFLPSSMPTLPTVKKVNPSDMPILFIALNSDTRPLYEVDEYAENVLAPRVAMVDGVAQVQVFGSQVYSPHVQVDPRKLASYGIGIDEVAAAIRGANVNLPTGTLYGRKTAYNVKANGQLYNADAFKPIVVAHRNGAPIRISDIGDAVDSVQTDKVATWFNNKRAVVLAVQRQPNSNTIEIVKQIRSLLPQFEAILPPSMKVNILFDRSESIQRSVADVKTTLLLTIVLVVLVIFLFLGNVSTTLIASATLPISIIGTFAAMKMMGFTINNISLMALTLCVGFVIDDAIVVIENIYRHLKKGEPPLMAALHGSQEVSFTVVSMTASLIAVFIPILFMGGVIGRLFFQFSATMTVAILISGFVSLSLTPMLCSKFLKNETHRGWAGRMSDGIIEKALSVYGGTLRYALRHRGFILTIFAAMLFISGILLMQMPKGFMPSEDTGQVMGNTQCQEGISFEEMTAHQKAVMKVIADDPNVSRFMSSIGSGGPVGTGNQGRLIIVLKPKGERKISSEQFIADVRKKTSKIAGVKVFLQNPPSIRMGGNNTKSLYQVSLSASDIPTLYKAANELEAKMEALPTLAEVTSELQVRNPQLDIKIDRDKLSKLGLNVSQLQDALASAYSARQISTIYAPNNQYWVILEVLPEFSRDPSMLSLLRIRSDSGQLVPLNAVASVTTGSGPMLVTHQGQFPSVTLSFNLEEGVSLGDAVSEIKELAAKTLPPDVTFSFQGNAQMFESSTQSLGFLLVLSVLVIYIVLGILYESFLHPITILTGLPSAGLGGLLILILFHKDLDLYGFLGLILLIGIVKKNAIMMIDFAVESQRTENTSAEDAIFEACMVRFRPIMMTTLAAIMGSLPIAFSIGQGAEARQPLGLTIVGGLLVSQVVTLYITPIFYLYLERLRAWSGKRHPKVLERHS